MTLLPSRSKVEERKRRIANALCLLKAKIKTAKELSRKPHCVPVKTLKRHAGEKKVFKINCLELTERAGRHAIRRAMGLPCHGDYGASQMREALTELLAAHLPGPESKAPSARKVAAKH